MPLLRRCLFIHTIVAPVVHCLQLSASPDLEASIVELVAQHAVAASIDLEIGDHHRKHHNQQNHSSKDLETSEDSEDLDTWLLADLETFEASEDLETGEASNDLETSDHHRKHHHQQNHSSKDLETGEASEDLETGEASEDLETGEASEDLEIGEASEDLEIGEASNNLETGNHHRKHHHQHNHSSKDLETGEASKDLETPALRHPFPRASGFEASNNWTDLLPSELNGEEWNELYDSGHFYQHNYSHGEDKNCTSMGHTQDQLDRVKEWTQHGPLHASKPVANRTKPLYLFLFVPPFWGSTALLSLVASSPEVTTLCSSGKWQCEGTWLLEDEGMVSNVEGSELWKWKRNVPSNWTKALSTYEQYWKQDRVIKVEKSPPNLAKVQQIADQFTHRKDEVAFIFMTRHACFGGEQFNLWGPYAELIRHGKQHLEFRGGFQVKELKYESLLRDPYGTAESLLEWLPDFKTLDPNVADIESEGSFDTDRNDPLAQYILKQGPFENEFTSIPEQMMNLSQMIGYRDASDS